MLCPRAVPHPLRHMKLHVFHPSILLQGKGGNSNGTIHEQPATEFADPNVRTLIPVADPARPIHERGHPGQIVDDHVLSREIANQQGRLAEALAPSNIEPKPFEMNARKGGDERAYLRDRKRLIKGGLSPEQADDVLAETLRWIINDALPRPMNPRVLDDLPSRK